jgi:sugar phosphate permease
VQGLLFISLTTRLPVLAEMFTLDELALSGLMLMMVLLAGVGSVAAEAVAKRASSAAALRVGLVLLGLGTLIMGFSVREPGTFAVFVTGLAIYGTGVGAVDASANMQAVTLEHQIGRPVLPSFHGAWTLGGIIATLIALTTADAVGWIGALALALLPLLAVAAPYFRRDAGVPDADTTKLGIPWRPIMLIGIGLVVFYTVDTATTAWGPLYLASSTVFAEPASSASLYALATLPDLVATLLARIVGDAATARFGAPTMIRVGATRASWLAIVSSPMGGRPASSSSVWAWPWWSSLSFGRGAVLLATSTRLRQRRVDAVIARF